MQNHNLDRDCFLPLPQWANTASGVRFTPDLDCWSYRDGVVAVSVNFYLLDDVSLRMRNSLKHLLVWYAENQSPVSLMNVYSHIKYFLNFLRSVGGQQVDGIAAIDFLNYYSSLVNSNFWYASHLAGYLKRWHRMRLYGIADDLPLLLRQIRLKGILKGKAVLTMCPYEGPFTDLELQSIQQQINRSYSQGLFADDDYMLAWLFILLGQRDVQYALLKVCDVLEVERSDGAFEYAIRVPRAKQATQLARSEFKERVLAPQFGKPLKQYADSVRLSFDGLMRDPAQAPLFPRRRLQGDYSTGFEYHRTAKELGASLSFALHSLAVISERTGGLMNITPSRFRRTIGTRAAQEGHSELVIAELLDHSDTQNVQVYVAATPAILERIDRAVAMQMAPLAQAFAGVIISSESEAVRGADPSSRIMDPRIDNSMKPMGNCGQYGFCGLLAPIACYSCIHFQPWLDGPHEAVLEHLLSERERLSANGDPRIAATNDRTILAVAEVIRLCEIQQKEQACD
ncbi:site-specific integrase [Pseudomonas cavernicola]|uniref:Site-specific integrase n=1 Tax=Pseudomonas cavernicola TaxID=2320866 RepID=A0A418XIA8_9PSED|nr:site-specific integrase [Pseudomonas cavernicola]RJG12190.1 site-specific integrase [Pseudomonas cavernicola]